MSQQQGKGKTESASQSGEGDDSFGTQVREKRITSLVCESNQHQGRRNRKRSFTSKLSSNCAASMQFPRRRLRLILLFQPSPLPMPVSVTGVPMCVAPDPDFGRSTRLQSTLGLLRETPIYLHRLRAKVKARLKDKATGEREDHS